MSWGKKKRGHGTGRREKMTEDTTGKGRSKQVTGNGRKGGPVGKEDMKVPRVCLILQVR